MLAAILALLPSASSAMGWLKVLLPGLVIGLMAAYGVYIFKDREVLQEKAAIAEDAARTNADTIAKMQKDKAVADQQVASYAAALDTRQQAITTIRKVILSAPNSKACVSSGPVIALLDGLRTGQATPQGQLRPAADPRGAARVQAQPGKSSR